MHPAKRKGDKAELEVQALIREHTGWPARRKLGAGRADDCGDIDGVPQTCIQVKDYKDITRAIREICDELPIQRARAEAPFGVGFVRRPGGRYVAVMPFEMWATYARESCGWAPRPDTTKRQRY